MNQSTNRRLVSIIAGIVAIASSCFGQASTCYQINPAHTGATVLNKPLTFPLVQKWVVTLPDQLSYPVIADGRVFVLSRSINGNYGTTLYAISETDGSILWQESISGIYFWATATYGDGRLYVINFNGTLQAVNPADGSQIWSVNLPIQYAFSSAPTFCDGMVFVGGAGDGGTLYSVDAATGNILWTQGVENGDNSSPAVVCHKVYVSYAGDQSYCFSEMSGNLVWHYNGPAEGGGGKTVAVSDAGVYVRDSYGGDLCLNANSGSLKSRYKADHIPAFAKSSRFLMSGGVLQACDVNTGKRLWCFSGDGQLSSAPIVVNNTVFVGSGSGRVYGLDSKTGKVVWQTTIGSIQSPDEQNVSQPLTGFAAGDGLIIFPATNELYAFGSQ